MEASVARRGRDPQQAGPAGRPPRTPRGPAGRAQFKSRSSKYLYSNVKPSFFLWPHFS